MGFIETAQAAKGRGHVSDFKKMADLWAESLPSLGQYRFGVSPLSPRGRRAG